MEPDVVHYPTQFGNFEHQMTAGYAAAGQRVPVERPQNKQSRFSHPLYLGGVLATVVAVASSIFGSPLFAGFMTVVATACFCEARNLFATEASNKKLEKCYALIEALTRKYNELNKLQYLAEENSDELVYLDDRVSNIHISHHHDPLLSNRQKYEDQLVQARRLLQVEAVESFSPVEEDEGASSDREVSNEEFPNSKPIKPVTCFSDPLYAGAAIAAVSAVFAYVFDRLTISGGATVLATALFCEARHRPVHSASEKLMKDYEKLTSLFITKINELNQKSKPDHLMSEGKSPLDSDDGW